MRFVVYGVPAPKGSMRAFMPKGARFPVVTHDSKRTKPWQEAIVSAAHEAMTGPPMQGPVSVVIQFLLPRPKSTPKRVGYPIKKPDLDKLVRTVLDGMTRAGIFRDDAQVVSLCVTKNFGTVPGAQVEVGEWVLT